MNKLILATALTLSTSMANAELWELEDASAWCDNTQTAVGQIMNSFNEKPFLIGQGYIYTGVEPINGELVLWMDPETQMYTISITLAEAPDTTCILTTGKGLRVYNRSEEES